MAGVVCEQEGRLVGLPKNANQVDADPQMVFAVSDNPHKAIRLLGQCVV
jgi:hypothetical protein